MLWKKESERGNALYVNIFRLLGNEDEYERDYVIHRNLNINPIVNKSNEHSDIVRMEGNKHFQNNDWKFAIVSYNASLCLADEGSEHISLAYANRSACFYHMKKYKECLIDIKLAREAGYPQHLMPKLNKREADCLKCIKEGGKQESGVILSLGPSENFPCLANVQEISQDGNGNLSIFATEDIDVGHTVAVEKAFSTYVYDENFCRGICSICLNECTNLVPCKKCTVAMVCHNECQHNSLHQFECGLRFGGNSNVNGGVMRVARTILMAIDLFPNVDDLMKFVEAAIDSDPNEIPDTLTDPKAKYRAFLKLPFNKTIGNYFGSLTYCNYKMLLEIPELNSMFQSEQHQRFLMHLICHNAIITKSYSSEVKSEYGTIIFTFMGIIQRYFKLSCAPNTMPIACKGGLGFVTVRPIKRGAELTAPILNPLLEPKEERQKLYDAYNFTCKCARCEGIRLLPEQKKQLDMDPLYRSILLNNAAEHSEERDKNLLDKCETFLRKYGDFPWCEEIGRVTNIYMKLSYIRYGMDKKITVMRPPKI